MRRRLAPSHDLCARMRYVPLDDSAWRSELIKEECAKIVAEFGEDADINPTTGHVFWRYFVGATRFDLTDPAILPYLDLEARPEIWHFRRLTLDERDQVAMLERQGKREELCRYVFVRGVTGLENGTGAAGIKLASALEAKDQKAILAALEDYAPSLLPEVADACIRGSQDLTEPEKKA